ncbi:MAG: radical SAM protein [Desulfurococcaceae archaeon]
MTKLKVIREFDPWKSPLCTCPRKYSLHPYTGCDHSCLYCYATSYIRSRKSVPKKKFLEALASDLEKVKAGSLIELSTSSDPYPPIEAHLMLTRRALELISKHRVRILITTKSNLVIRDLDILKRTQSAAMVTITTLDENVARKIEPYAPSVEQRLRAVEELSRNGIPVGVRVDPIIPHVNDDPYMLEELVGRIREAGAKHIVTSTYKAKWDNFNRLLEVFPEIRNRLRELYVEKGLLIHGYRYLPKSIREDVLMPVIKHSEYYGLTVATCREGLGTVFFKAPSCDGSHLIDKR